MKKKRIFLKKICFFVVPVLLIICIIYNGIIISEYRSCDTGKALISDSHEYSIVFKGKTYKDVSPVWDFPERRLILFKPHDYYEEDYLIKQGKLSDYILPAKTFEFLDSRYDTYKNFIVTNRNHDMELIYVSDDIVYPTIETTEIENVWIYNAFADYEPIAIQDSEIVNELVSLLDYTSISLSKKTLAAVKHASFIPEKTLWYICFRFKGYPLGYKCYLEEQENGEFKLIYVDNE